MDDKKNPFRYTRVLRIIGILIALALLIPLAYLVLTQGLDAVMPSSLPLAAVVLMGVYAVKSVVVFIPFVAIFIFTGAIYPMGWAILITALGLSLDASLSYAFGHWLGHDRVEAIIARNDKARQLIDRYRDKLGVACFLCRLLPIIPYEPASMFFGAAGLRKGEYWLMTILGVIPNSLPFVIAGEYIDNPLSWQFLVPFLISVVFAIAMFFVVRLLERRKTPHEANN